jgi:hypothetical protein
MKNKTYNNNTLLSLAFGALMSDILILPISYYQSYSCTHLHLENHFHSLAIGRHTHLVNLNNLCLCTLCNYREEHKPKKKVNLKMEMKSSEVGKNVHFYFFFVLVSHTFTEKKNLLTII